MSINEGQSAASFMSTWHKLTFIMEEGNLNWENVKTGLWARLRCILVDVDMGVSSLLGDSV